MFVISLAVVPGCLAESEPAPGPWTSAADTLQIQTCHGQSTDPGDEFTLGAVVVDGGDLLLDVQTGGGCAAHRFAICWDGSSTKSDPPQIDLELTHDGHDPCDAWLSFQLRVDPAALRAAGLPPVVIGISGQSRQLEGTTAGVLLSD